LKNLDINAQANYYSSLKRVDDEAQNNNSKSKNNNSNKKGFSNNNNRNKNKNNRNNKNTNSNADKDDPVCPIHGKHKMLQCTPIKMLKKILTRRRRASLPILTTEIRKIIIISTPDLMIIIISNMKLSLIPTII
jgi:hypothetical protein